MLRACIVLNKPKRFKLLHTGKWNFYERAPNAISETPCHRPRGWRTERCGCMNEGVLQLQRAGFMISGAPPPSFYSPKCKSLWWSFETSTRSSVTLRRKNNLSSRTFSGPPTPFVPIWSYIMTLFPGNAGMLSACFAAMKPWICCESQQVFFTVYWSCAIKQTCVLFVSNSWHRPLLPKDFSTLEKTNKKKSRREGNKKISSFPLFSNNNSLFSCLPLQHRDKSNGKTPLGNLELFQTWKFGNPSKRLINYINK